MPKPLLGWQLVLDARPHQPCDGRRLGSPVEAAWVVPGWQGHHHEDARKRTPHSNRSIKVSRWLLQRVFRLNEHPINAADTTTQHRFRLPNEFLILLVLSMHRDSASRV